MNEEIFLQQLGLIVKAKRRSLDLSQEELAWRCNITKNGLGKIELGKSQVRITTLKFIMRELNLSFADLHELDKYINDK